VQALLQQSPASVHATPAPRHTSGGRSQCSAACPWSRQVAAVGVPQQPSTANPSPLQRSPAGWHAERSATHFAPTQAFEQHWSFVAQSAPCRAQTARPHVPPLQASEQQSVAARQAWPSAKRLGAR